MSEDVLPAMSVQTANALVTGAPCAEEQLRAAMRHYATVENLLSISGPRFANARNEAARWHNTAVQRLRENMIEQRLREQRHAEQMAGLVELKVEG